MRRAFAAIVLGAVAFILTSVSAAPAQRSFLCAYSEPWDMLVVAGGSVWWSPLSDDTGTGDSVTQHWTKATGKISNRSDGGVVFTGKVKGGPLGVRVEYDSVAAWLETDRAVEWNSYLTGPAENVGGCMRFPDGAAARKVVGVASNDALNVRTLPNATAPVVATSPSGGVLFQLPGKSGAWVRVAKLYFPEDEQEPTTTVTGWVNARFLGPLT